MPSSTRISSIRKPALGLLIVSIRSSALEVAGVNSKPLHETNSFSLPNCVLLLWLLWICAISSPSILVPSNLGAQKFYRKMLKPSFLSTWLQPYPISRYIQYQSCVLGCVPNRGVIVPMAPKIKSSMREKRSSQPSCRLPNHLAVHPTIQSSKSITNIL